MTTDPQYYLIVWGTEEVPFAFGVATLEEALVLVSAAPSWPVVCGHPNCPLRIARIEEAIIHPFRVGENGEEIPVLCARLVVDEGRVDITKLRVVAVPDREHPGTIAGFFAKGH